MSVPLRPGMLAACLTGVAIASGTGSALADPVDPVEPLVPVVPVEPAAEATSGRLRVTAKHAPESRLVLEGVELGALPWTGSLAPGSYTLWIAAGMSASGPTTVTIVAGKLTTVDLKLPSGPPAPKACASSDDCPGGVACVDGACERGVAAAEEAEEQEPPAAKEGEACGERACGEGLLCVADRCMRRELAPMSLRTGLAAEWMVLGGLGGQSRYPSAAHLLGVRLDAPLGRYARYHVTLAYLNLNARGAVRVAPLGLGSLIPAWKHGEHQILVEPGLDAVLSSWSELVQGDIDFHLGSALWTRVHYRHRKLFVTFTPIQLEMVWLRVAGNRDFAAAWTPTGYNYGAGLGIGVLP